jgi:hypothetical protein
MLASLAACVLVVQLVQSPPPTHVVPTLHAVQSPTVQAHRPAALTPLYVSFAALQGLDVYSTSRALSSGVGREANPAMRGIVGNPAGLIAVKAATAATAIWAAEKMWKRHPRAAIVFMTALNSAMAAVVAHNYSLR